MILQNRQLMTGTVYIQFTVRGSEFVGRSSVVSHSSDPKDVDQSLGSLLNGWGTDDRDD